MNKFLSSTATLAVTLLALAGSAQAADKLTLTMNWRADSAHLGFAMAEKAGFYAEEDLDVTLEEGRGSSVAAQLVASGQAELGYADAGAALNVASKGAPIRIISTIWKAGQFGIAYLDSSGISEPKDLVGKKVAVASGTAMVPLMSVFLKANGIDEGDVEIVTAAQNANLGLLTSGGVDAVAETPENVVVPLAAEGIAASNMYFYNHGVPLVSLSLIAREDKISENADLYKRFVRATLRGWRAAMDDPEAAVDALKEIFPDSEKSREGLLTSATYSFASVCPGGAGDHIGVTSPESWDTTYGVMTTAMEFPTTKPITDYYSLDVLPTEPVVCP